MINLNNYGWNSRLNQLKQKSTYSTFTHGRISIVHVPVMKLFLRMDYFSVNSQEI